MVRVVGGNPCPFFAGEVIGLSALPCSVPQPSGTAAKPSLLSGILMIPPPRFPTGPYFLLCQVFVFVYKGAKSLNLDETSFLISLGWGLGLGSGVALALVPTAIPALRRRVLKIYGDGTRKVFPVRPRRLVLVRVV